MVDTAEVCLVKTVAAAICASPNDPEIRNIAETVIAIVREHDAQAEVMRCLGAIRAHDATVVESPQWTPEEMARMLARNSLPIPINMIYDPDDYSHPLSLVGGSRFETGGLKS